MSSFRNARGGFLLCSTVTQSACVRTHQHGISPGSEWSNSKVIRIRCPRDRLSIKRGVDIRAT